MTVAETLGLDPEKVDEAREKLSKLLPEAFPEPDGNMLFAALYLLAKVARHNDYDTWAMFCSTAWSAAEGTPPEVPTAPEVRHRAGMPVRAPRRPRARQR